MGLDHFTTTETVLVVANIQPVRLQILRRLCRFMIRNYCYELISLERAEVRGTHLSPKEVAITWFHRAIIGRGLVSNPPRSALNCFSLQLIEGSSWSGMLDGG